VRYSVWNFIEQFRVSSFRFRVYQLSRPKLVLDLDFVTGNLKLETGLQVLLDGVAIASVEEADQK